MIGVQTAMKRVLFGCLMVALLGVATVGHAGAQSGSAPSDALDIPPEVAQHQDDWPLPGRDYENSRARLDSTITSKTVERLQVAWSVPLPGAGAYGNASSTPLIVGDTVYVQDLGSNVKAVDLATGAVKWSHDYNEFQIGPNGPAIGYGKIYVAAGSQAIAALDATTGEQLW